MIVLEILSNKLSTKWSLGYLLKLSLQAGTNMLYIYPINSSKTNSIFAK